jgi:predicted PurR-regulated permease PerM
MNEQHPRPPVESRWHLLHIWQIQFVRDVLVIALVVGLVLLGHRLSIVTVPLLLALALAYLFEPLVAKMTRNGRVGRGRVAISIIVLSTLLVGVPVLLGVGYSVVQGLTYTQGLVRSIDVVFRSVREPDNEERLRQVEVRGPAWVWLRDRIVEQRAEMSSSGMEGTQGAPATGENGFGGEFMPNGERGTQPDANPDAMPDAWPRARPDGQGGASLDAKQDGGPGAKPDAKADAKPDSEKDQSPKNTVEKLRDASEMVLSEVLGIPTDDIEPMSPELSPDEPSTLFQGLVGLRDWLGRNSTVISRNIVTAGGGALGAAVSTIGSIGKFIFGAFLTAFFFYFVCTGYGRVAHLGKEMVPDQHRARVLDLVAKMDVVISGFIRGRLIIAGIMMATYTLGFLLIGVPAPYITGPIVGLLTIVPYAAGAMAPVAMLLMLLQPGTGWQSTWWWAIAGPLLVLGVTQFMDDYILTPRIQGKTTNMDVPTILFASIAGGVLAGFYGLLLAIPVAACIKILIVEVFWPRFKEWAKGDAPDVLPIADQPKV